MDINGYIPSGVIKPGLGKWPMNDPLSIATFDYRRVCLHKPPMGSNR